MIAHHVSRDVQNMRKLRTYSLDEIAKPAIPKGPNAAYQAHLREMRRERRWDATALYTPNQVADRFKVDRETVYEWIYARKLFAYKIGSKSIRISEAQLQKFLGNPESPDLT